MRRILLVILINLFFCSALAEIPCECHSESCLCFIQEGDEGMAVDAIQNALVAQGFLSAQNDAAIFDAAAKQAVIDFQHAFGLDETGMLDDDTLTLLLWGMLPEELDAAQPETSTLPVWIPTDGGTRHHDNPDCSGMFDPRLVSQRNALAMGLTHCGRCKPDGYHR